MLVPRTLLTLSLITASLAGTAAQDASPDVEPMQAPAPAAVDDPMASFARLVGGEWQVTFASGARAFHAWHWGPGKHSMRRMAYGPAHEPDAATNPWAGEVMYWHPGRGQVCLLSLHEDIPAVGRGVGDGTIRFDGETSDAVLDLYQPRGLRKLAQRQIFEGPDKYREELLEDGGAGFQPLNTLNFVRVEERSATSSPSSEPAPIELPEHWKPFEALVGGTWESNDDSPSGNTSRIHSTFEWVASLEVVLARVHAPKGEGEPTHLLDAYIYRHVRDDALRCLALSREGGVYEGTATVLDGGALQIDVKAYEGDRAVPLVARFEFEDDGQLRTHVWSLGGAERTLRLDVEHRKREAKRG